MRVISYLLYLFCLCIVVKGASDANIDKITICDAKSPYFGCEPQYWISGDRLRCGNATQIMAWASKAVKSECYVVTAGEESNPKTTYLPDSITLINIRVTCYTMMYRGLLIYAVDAAGNRVGDWEITNEEPTWFRTPWKESPSHECFGALMHASADLKPYHSILYFKAPPAGTGKITFHTLIKYGNANTGAFYWPQTDLSLDEAAITEQSPVSFYKLSEPGQSCAELCESNEGYVCDEFQTQLSSNFSASIMNSNVCLLPLISGCGTEAGTYDPETQFCYFPDSTCLSQGRPAATYSCTAKDQGIARACGCVATESQESSATIRAASILTLLAIFFVNPRLGFLVMVVFGLSSAHNWINHQSRSPGASGFRPYRPATSDLPHVMVGPNQTFQLEWMGAHDSYTYFVILHEKDANYSKLHDWKMLNDYIKLAPLEATINASSGIYQKFHRKAIDSTDCNYTDSEISRGYVNKPSYYERIVRPGDPLFVARHPRLTGMISAIRTDLANSSKFFQAQYKMAQVREDVRVSYKSEKYPWIEAVYKFKHSLANQAHEPDFANFWIPGRAGFGRYIVHWVWNGYYDAIDVDYVPNQVQDIYGTPNNKTIWTRVDHCLYDFPYAVYGFTEVLSESSLNWCKSKCELNSLCTGVNVVPVVPPKSVYRGFTKPSGRANWIFPEIYGTDIYVPWNLTRQYTTAFNASDFLAEAASPDRYVCYGVYGKVSTETEDQYSLAKDPNDPVFYSTCYVRYSGNMFPGYENTLVSKSEKGPWKWNDKCLTCDSQQSAVNASSAPRWEVADICVNCDRVPAEPKKSDKLVPVLVEAYTRCDGYAVTWNSYKHHTCATNRTCQTQLLPVGRALDKDAITLEECSMMVQRDIRCSNTFSFLARGGINRCYCYNSDPCCLNCSRIRTFNYDVYELKTVADPTCATGVLSKDLKACCSGSCGAGNCLPTNNGTVAAVGFCCSAGITRSCDVASPPCLVTVPATKKRLI